MRPFVKDEASACRPCSEQWDRLLASFLLHKDSIGFLENLIWAWILLHCYCVLQQAFPRAISAIPQDWLTENQVLAHIKKISGGEGGGTGRGFQVQTVDLMICVWSLCFCFHICVGFLLVFRLLITHSKETWGEFRTVHSHSIARVCVSVCKMDLCLCVAQRLTVILLLTESVFFFLILSLHDPDWMSSPS